MQQEEQEIITRKKALKRIMKLVVPFSVSRVISVSGNFASMIMLSRVNMDTLAASSLISTYQTLLIGTGTSILYSVGAKAGRVYGEEDVDAIRSTLHNGFIVSLIIAAPVTILSLTNKQVLISLGQSPVLSNISGNYFYPFSFGIAPIICLSSEEQVSLAVNRASDVAGIVLLNSGLTSLLGYLLIFGEGGFPKLGATGLGYAFSISAWTSLVSYTLFLKFYPTYKKFNFFQFNNGISKDVVKNLFQIGFPIGLQVGGELFTSMFITIMFGWIGEESLASQQIVSEYLLWLTIPIFSASQASSILVSQEIGKNNAINAQRLGNMSIALNTSISLLALSVFSIIPDILASAFIDVNDNNNYQIVSTARALFVINGSAQIFSAIRNVGTGSLRGLFDTLFPMLINLTGNCALGVLLGYLFGFPAEFGILGISIARGFGEITGAACIYNRWHSKIVGNIKQNSTISHDLIEVVHSTTDNVVESNTDSIGGVIDGNGISDSRVTLFSRHRTETSIEETPLLNKKRYSGCCVM